MSIDDLIKMWDSYKPFKKYGTCCDTFMTCDNCPLKKGNSSSLKANNCLLNSKEPFKNILSALLKYDWSKKVKKSNSLLKMNLTGGIKMNSLFIVGRLVKDWNNISKTDKKCYINSIAWDESKEKTHFFDLKILGELGDKVVKYTHKGSKVGISGVLTTESFTNKEGENVKRVVIRVTSCDFLDTKDIKQTEE